MSEAAVLEKLVATWSYKPGCRLELLEDNIAYPGAYRLHYQAWVPNVDDPDLAPGFVGVDHTISDMELEHYKDDEHYWRHVIHDLIRKMELHEISEWLKYDGVHDSSPGH